MSGYICSQEVEQIRKSVTKIGVQLDELIYDISDSAKFLDFAVPRSN
jgi:hypothetical protein